MQYSFWIGYESEKLKSLYWYSIWKRLKVTIWGPLRWSPYANTTLNHDKMTIDCALLTPQWKQSFRSLSTQVGETWSLKCSIAWLDRQNKKVPTILIITEAKYVHFFVCKRTGFVHQRLKDFVKWLRFSVSNLGFPELEIRFFCLFPVTRVFLKTWNSCCIQILIILITLKLQSGACNGQITTFQLSTIIVTNEVRVLLGDHRTFVVGPLIFSFTWPI